MKQFDSGAVTLSPGQRPAGPGLAAAGRGQQADTLVKDSVRNDPNLSHLWVSRSGEFGPEFHDIATSTWWDVTTSKGWQGNLNRYGLEWGEGIGLFTE
ncbi:hypothetical protein [Cellulomonas shaoxiangyii]|uniref:hypothetical protein n=1 Tax=Cellulomonas shaoxiangyii TaxID=2566013 RepID=UPI0010946BEF|nr:hypothetical protein [Cellulomonas shaoxiangyii]TGY82636.1 hypothetical protein E5226_13065 [Cellulomonas shaoxiangyii]